MSDPEVLVAGAGPTGLVLALSLARQGVRVRVVDPAPEPGTTSRALVVHARTLELYRQLGIADDVVNDGLKFTSINMWVRGELAAHAELGAMGKGISPFPFMMIYPQDRHERMLLAHLERAGVRVERRTRVASFEARADGIAATLESVEGTTPCEASFLAGCDGARSTVREALGIGFPGNTYERVFYVADVTMHGPPASHELHIALDEAELLALFPLAGDRAVRLIGTVRRDVDAGAQAKLTWDDVAKDVMDHLRIHVDEVHWFSTYRVHHRVAQTFRRGRVFLAGDAAHIHSPVGGQGMNTGIGDAVNLAWKLADVLRGRAPEALLDTYEPERIAFARRLVATTDRAFTFVTNDGPLARRVRMDAVPFVVPRVLKSERMRRYFFKTVSQTQIRYRESALSEGSAGIHGGDRLPWVAFDTTDNTQDNYAPLTSRAWQAHVYGEASAPLRAACEALHLPLHVFAWNDAAKVARLVRDALYVVRPDGYVGLATRDVRALDAYVAARGLRFGESAAGR